MATVPTADEFSGPQETVYLTWWNPHVPREHWRPILTTSPEDAALAWMHWAHIAMPEVFGCPVFVYVVDARNPDAATPYIVDRDKEGRFVVLPEDYVFPTRTVR